MRGGENDCIERLEPRELRDALRQLDLREVICGRDSRLSISANRVRGFVGDDPFVAVAATTKADVQVQGFLDALYWRDVRAPGHPGRYFIGSGPHLRWVQEALGSLSERLRAESDLAVFVEGRPADLTAPDFAGEKLQWLKLLRRRDELLESPPELVRNLKNLVAHPEFRWHLTVRATKWSGRLGGLQVCTVDPKGRTGVVSVGSAASTHAAAKAFRLLSPTPFKFDAENVAEAAALIRKLAEGERGKLGDPEHHLEDKILQGRTVLHDPDSGRPLVSALPTSQFPAVWWTGDKGNRYTDLLMRDGDVPWVVELKVESKGQGQGYRHAVGQVALYAAFIERATGLRPWFEDHGLDPAKCRAAVAFPAIKGARAAEHTAAVRRLAWALDVTVFELAPT